MIAGMFALGWRAMLRFVFYERAIVPADVGEKIAALAGDVATLLYGLSVGFGVPAPCLSRIRSIAHVLCLALGMVVRAIIWPGRCVHLLYGCGRLYCRYTSFFRLCLG